MKTARVWLLRMLSPALLIILLFFLLLPRPVVRDIRAVKTVEVVDQGEALELNETEREQLLAVLATARCRPSHLELGKQRTAQTIRLTVTADASPPAGRVELDLGDRPRCAFPQSRWPSYHLNRAEQLLEAMEPICQAARLRAGT